MLNMGQSYFSLTDGVGGGRAQCGAVPRMPGQEHALHEILLGRAFFPSTFNFQPALWIQCLLMNPDNRDPLTTATH